MTWALLDRDGTINAGAPEPDYVTSATDVKLLSRAGEAIARLNGGGLPVAVVTNQRGVALGIMSEEDLDAVNDAVRAQLARAGAHVDAILCCTHHRGSCDCRKPGTGLLEQAATELDMPLEQAVVVGDSELDVEAGRRVGALTIRLAAAGTRTRADFVVPTLWEAVDLCMEAAGRC